MAEMEGKGLDYERYALNKLFKRIVARAHGIRSVLEIPGEGREGDALDLLDRPSARPAATSRWSTPRRRSRWAWDELGYDVTYCRLRRHHEHRPRGCKPRPGLELHVPLAARRQGGLLREMMRLSRRYVMFIASTGSTRASSATARCTAISRCRGPTAT